MTHCSEHRPLAAQRPTEGAVGRSRGGACRALIPRGKVSGAARRRAKARLVSARGAPLTVRTARSRPVRAGRCPDQPLPPVPGLTRDLLANRARPRTGSGARGRGRP